VFGSVNPYKSDHMEDLEKTLETSIYNVVDPGRGREEMDKKHGELNSGSLKQRREA